MRTAAIFLTTLQVLVFIGCTCSGLGYLVNQPNAVGLLRAVAPLCAAILSLATLTITMAVHAAADKIAAAIRVRS